MLDAWTIAVCVALVIVVSAVTFIIDTLLWREDAAGRVWSLALTAGMGAVVAVVLWVSTGLTWVSIVVNSLFVYAWMLIWAGLRVYNGKPPKYGAMAIPAIVVGAATLLPQPMPSTPGMFAAALAIAGASVMVVRETLIGRLHGKRFARPMTAAFAVMAVYAIALAAVSVLRPQLSPQDPGIISLQAYLIVIMLVTVVAITNATLLRAENIIASLDVTRGVPWDYLSRGILGHDAFMLVMQDWLNRARIHDAPLALYCIDLDDRVYIEQAFGRDEYELILSAWRDVIQMYAPPHADLSELSPTRMAVMTPAQSNAELDAWAQRWRLGLLESVDRFPIGFHPTISVGVATTTDHGWGYQRLTAAAIQAAGTVADRGGDGTLVLPADAFLSES